MFVLQILKFFFNIFVFYETYLVDVRHIKKTVFCKEKWLSLTKVIKTTEMLNRFF